MVFALPNIDMIHNNSAFHHPKTIITSSICSFGFAKRGETVGKGVGQGGRRNGGGVEQGVRRNGGGEE